MGKRTGRPKKAAEETKNLYLQVRIEATEKAGFDAAANMAGVPLSVWVRERLRKIAAKELAAHGQLAEFARQRQEARGKSPSG